MGLVPGAKPQNRALGASCEEDIPYLMMASSRELTLRQAMSPSSAPTSLVIHRGLLDGG